MSQQADGLKPCDWQAAEDGHGMQSNNNAHDKLNNHVFLCSKSNSIVTPTHPPFIDDELVTWLQYPLDDDSCPDIFQHWPLPPPSPAAAAAAATATAAADGFTPPPSALKAPPLDIAPDPPPTAFDGGIPFATDHETNDPSSNAFRHDRSSSATPAVSQERVGAAEQGNPLFKHGNEAAPSATFQQGGGRGACARLDDERESVAKDCRKLAHLKLSPHGSQAAKQAQLSANVSAKSKHLIAEKTVAADATLDNRRAHTAQFKHSAQDEREQGLQKMANTRLKFPHHYSAKGSSSGHKLQKEASANAPHRKEKSWMEKDMSRKPSVITDSAQAVNAQAASAEAALALGAGRAAGVIRASGMEAFSKVRTALQSIPPSKLGSSPSGYTLSPASPSGNFSSYPAGCSSPILPPRGRAFGFRDVTLCTQPAQQNDESKLQNTAQPHVFRPCVNMHSIVSQEHHLMNPLNGDSNSNEHSSKNSHLESSTTALRGSQGLSVMFKQVHSAEQAKEGANVGGSTRAAAFYGMDTCDMQKLSGLSLPYREKREDFAFSGGSETSESLKETISGSKRMLEDSECQSEDAEGGESPVNSQTRSSGSKRTRANEVHNLSERRRRNRINDKMNALRDLIPNASKSNKAALLDEAIDYLKNLQLQLQVMSLRTGVSLSPMVVPPGLPHMQIPQASPFHPMGIGTAGGSMLVGGGSTVGVAMCDMTYGVPARPLGNLTSSEPRMLQPSESSSNNQLQALTVPQSIPLNFPHSFVQAPSQSIFSVNMDMYNTYLQQQQQQQQQQQLQQHLQHQEHLASPHVQAPFLPSPSSQQQSHYQH